jgi:2-dehydropantoate 2-reductase
VGEIFDGRIGVIGSGALGAFYGARLLRSGRDVHFLMRRDYEHVREHGLQVYSKDGDFHLRPPVYESVDELGRCDLVIIGLKTTDNAAIPELLAPICDAHTIVLTLQNGLGNEEAIASALERFGSGAEQVIGGVAFLCSNRTAPGVINHTDHGWLRIAEFRGEPRLRTHAIAAAFEKAGISCEVHRRVVAIRWEKLVWNVPFNGLGVAANRADSAIIMGDDTLFRCARGLMEEVVAAARADDVEVTPSHVERMIDYTRSMGAYKSSMQIDYENGRPLEIEAIIGEPMRRAQCAGIPVPRMEMLYGVIRRSV